MMAYKIRLGFLLFLFSALTALAGLRLWPAISSEEAGKHIYREGLLSSGKPLEATVGNLQLTGGQVACVNCHRRSGFGTSEGGLIARPITGPGLFSTYNAPKPKLLSSAAIGPAIRPAYTEETLGRAIREGVDATGRPLNAAMPRFTLDEGAMKSLIGYLKTLSATPSPGVSSDSIHFATVITPGVTPAKRQAMMDVMETFIRDKNAGTRNETLRAERAGWDMEREYQAYRKWQLHVWELTGAPETWPAQLEAHYRRQPVFALLSGITAGTWRPIHNFCERFELPCLFPNADAPPVEENAYYSFYFSKGVILEAQTLAHFLNKNAKEIGKGPIVQVFRNDEIAGTAAKAFREASNAHLSPIVDIGISPDQPLTDAFWSNLIIRENPSILVLWLNETDLKALNIPSGVRVEIPSPRLYFSSTLATGVLSSPLSSLEEKARLVHSFELPGQMDKRLLRTSAWLKARKIEPSDRRIQANTYFALTQTGNALMHLVDNFSRDYFIELIEHGVDNSISTSVYPRLGLGPGQRFAANGCNIIEPATKTTGEWMTVGAWITP